MDYVEHSSTGLDVSRLCLGCVHLGIGFDIPGGELRDDEIAERLSVALKRHAPFTELTDMIPALR